MSVFNDVVEKIKLDLSQSTELSGIKFVDADREEKVPNPIKNVYVSLGISKIDIKEGALNAYLGMTSVGEQYGNHAEIYVEMKIFAPRKNGGKLCYDAFSKIYEDLLYRRRLYNIESISCEKPRYNNDIFSFELDCTIKLAVYLGYETEEISIGEIMVKKGSKR